MKKIPEELTCQDVREFLLRKKEEGLKATTLNLYNSAIRFFFRNVLHVSNKALMGIRSPFDREAGVSHE